MSADLVPGHAYRLEGKRGTWIYKYETIHPSGQRWLTFYGPTGQNQMYRSFDPNISYKLAKNMTQAVPMMGPRQSQRLP